MGGLLRTSVGESGSDGGERSVVGVASGGEVATGGEGIS